MHLFALRRHLEYLLGTPFAYTGIEKRFGKGNLSTRQKNFMEVFKDEKHTIFIPLLTELFVFAQEAKPQYSGSGKDVIAMSNGFPSGLH